GVERFELLVSQLGPISHAGRVVLEKYVAGADKAMQDFPSAGLFYVDGKALLVAVKPDVAGRESPDRCVPMPDKVADTGALYLNDVSAHVRQDLSAERTG